MIESKTSRPVWLKALYGLFGLVLIIICIHLSFPYDAIKDRIEKALSLALDKDITLGHITPGLLWGFTVDGLEVNGVKVAQEFKVSPHLFDLITGTLGFGFVADLTPSGRFEGSLRLPSLTSKRAMKIDLFFDQVDITRLAAFFPQDAKPIGELSGRISFSSPRNSFDTATGSLSLTWQNGLLPLPYNGIPFDELTFDKFVVDSSIDKGILTIKKANFTGQTPGKLTGSIALSSEIKSSRMNITGEMVLPQTAKQELGITDPSNKPSDFSIMGNLSTMRFRFMTPLGSPILIASKHRPNTASQQENESSQGMTPPDDPFNNQRKMMNNQITVP